MRRYIWNLVLLPGLVLAGAGVARAAEPADGERQAPAPGREIPEALDSAFRAMYDLDFPRAESELAQFTAEHPGNPLGPVAQAASLLFSIFERHGVLESEFFSSDQRYAKRQKITPEPAVREHFLAALDQAERLANESLRGDGPREGPLFTLTLVYGLRADYAALIEGQDLRALRFSSKGNEWARKLLAVAPECYGAYVATGMEKYLVGLKPAPVRWMLRLGGVKGDRDQGLRELELAAVRGRYLAPFARILLAIAHLRKHELPQAIGLLSELHQEFPHNPLFAKEMARIARLDPQASAGSDGGTL